MEFFTSVLKIGLDGNIRLDDKSYLNEIFFITSLRNRSKHSKN